ncbi:ankyrin repeat-containing domain protein [Xylaria grammica]|nr:ankyrin repeat-containing domain protein [Xylaria grammica]
MTKAEKNPMIYQRIRSWWRLLKVPWISFLKPVDLHLMGRLAQRQRWPYWISEPDGTPFICAIKSKNWPLATEAGHLDTVEFLLRHNANHPEGFHRGHLGIKRTITKLAPYADPAVAASQPKFVSPDYHAVLERLIQAGGDTLKENTEAREALAQGIDLGVDFSVVEILLDADVDPLISVWHGLDCFQLALLNGSEKVCRHLWDPSRAHPRPSHWLQHSECTISSIKQVFVQALALATAIDIPDDRGGRLLFSAALKGNQALVETLLAHGANVEAADYAGRTLLWAAVYGGNPGAVNASLKVGANVSGSVMSLRLEKHCEDSGTGVEARSTWLLSDTPIGKPGASLCRDRTSVTVFIRLRMVVFQGRPKKMLEVVELLVQEGVDIRDTIQDLRVEDVVMFEHQELLWDKLRDAPSQNDTAEGN